MAVKRVTMLENNPEVMQALASKLGLTPNITFQDIYTLDEEELKHRTGTALALITIIPPTPTWKADREKEDAAGVGEDYHREGSSNSPIVWFKQTIRDACGSIALLHAAVNGGGKEHIIPGSVVDKIRNDAIPLAMEERAQMLHDSVPFEEAHQAVATMGDTETPEAQGYYPEGHFVAFVKAEGRLWELEGARKGPIDRGELGPDEDALSPKAIELGLGRIITMEKEVGKGDLRFSCVAMVKE